ncbi:MAG: hypothetical protein AB9856_16800 [Cellulosilyticaceae bacterium]
MGKKGVSMVLAVTLMLQLVACGDKGAATVVVSPVATAVVEEEKQENPEISGQVEEPELDYSTFVAEDFKDFFTQYFSLTEAEILRFNQSPIYITEDYYNINDECSERLNTLLKGYLSDGVKKKLEAGYYRACFDLPKKLEMNEYITYGAAKVEDVQIVGTRPQESNRVYEVALTTTNKVKSVSQGNKDYVWDEEKQYYIPHQNATKPTQAFLVNNRVSDALDDSYSYQQVSEGQPMDEIKLIQNYWVEVAAGEVLKIETVKEAVPVTMNARQRATNTKFVTRIPYSTEISPSNKSKVIKVLNSFIGQPKAFYDSYKKTMQSGYNAFLAMLKTPLDIEAEMIHSEITYKNAFNENLNPYKDNMVKIAVDQKGITLVPSVYATKVQPRFKAIVPIKAVLSTGEEMSYQYEYLIGMEKDKIEFIQFIGSTNSATEKTQ